MFHINKSFFDVFDVYFDVQQLSEITETDGWLSTRAPQVCE